MTRNLKTNDGFEAPVDYPAGRISAVARACLEALKPVLSESSPATHAADTEGDGFVHPTNYSIERVSEVSKIFRTVVLTGPS